MASQLPYNRMTELQIQAPQSPSQPTVIVANASSSTRYELQFQSERGTGNHTNKIKYFTKDFPKNYMKLKNVCSVGLPLNFLETGALKRHGA